MKFILRYRSLLFVLIALCAQLAIFFILSHRADAITPPGRVHALYNLDLYYPDFIRQSKMGSWSIFDAHTTLPTPNIYSYIFFVLAGKVAALANIDPVLMYQITRVTGGIAVFLATYWLITLLLPSSLHIVAILFTLIIDTGPQWASLFRVPMWQWTPAMPEQAIIARHFFGFPHHLWGEAMGLALICMILRAIKKPTAFSLISILVLGLLGTSTSPPYFVILTLGLLCPWLLYGLVTKTLKKTAIPVLLAIGAIVAAGLWIKFEFAKGPPWDAFVAVERSWWTTSSILIPFVQSFGIYYPFVILLFILLPFGWKKWPETIQRAVFLTTCWCFLSVPMILLSSYPWFPIINGRIASDLSPVPIGILATIGIYAWQRSSHVFRLPKGLIQTLLFLITGLSFILSSSYIQRYMQEQDALVYQNYQSWTIYMTKNLWNGMMALKGVPAYSNVMVLPSMGEVLPAYFPLRVYSATPHSFSYWAGRRYQSYRFYTGEMNPDELKFLAENNISYVFYGPEEQAGTTTKTFYPDILEVMYKNPDVTIFTIRKKP
jgi:hypothetical protein